MSWSTTQQIALAIVPKCSAFLSLMGSFWIITEISTTKEKAENVYHRLLFSMSIYDVVESVWNFASTWPIPRGTEGIWGATGTIQTCVSQGFFLQLGLAIPIYNASLAIYYLLVIRYGTPERVLRSRVEPFMHTVAFVFAGGTAFAAIGLDLFNNANLWCWIAPLPLDCKDSHLYGDEANCVRGDNAWIYRWALYFGPLWCCILSSMVIMLMVYQSVAHREAATVFYRHPEAVEGRSTAAPSCCGGRESSLPTALRDATASISPVEADPPQRNSRSVLQRLDSWRMRGSRRRAFNPRSREVFNQAMWYIAAFYMTHLFSTVNRILQQTRGSTFYPLIVLHSFFDPLQGFLNFLVYRRPRYLKHRKEDMTRVDAVKATLRLSFFVPVHEREPVCVSAQLARMDRREELRVPPMSLPSSSSLSSSSSAVNNKSSIIIRCESRRSSGLMLLTDSDTPPEPLNNDASSHGWSDAARCPADSSQ